jgi:nitroimidazol reductase NimA-like FMN-containing flavoprotein (pyridoxamine 5'-phosphate oxidase superfamily)
MEREHRERLAALLRDQHVLVLATLGPEWPTTTLQAFAETEDLHLILILREESERYHNIRRNPRVTVHVDTRDKGIEGFRVARASIRGVAHEVPRQSEEWERLKAIFLAKNPFEEPFFAMPTLRMIRIEPVSVSYADGAGPEAVRFTATF